MRTYIPLLVKKGAIKTEVSDTLVLKRPSLLTFIVCILLKRCYLYVHYGSIYLFAFFQLNP